MSDNEQKKVCGFDKKPCIKAECIFWTEIILGTPLGPKKTPMCVFPALLLVTGSPKPQLQQIPLDKFGLKV